MPTDKRYKNLYVLVEAYNGLEEYLKFHEADIALSQDDFYKLKPLFTEMFGHEPSEDLEP